MKCRRLQSTGLTLVEVLVAMAIVAMVFAALTQLQDGGSRAALRASLTAEASVLCQSELDAWLAGNRRSSPTGTAERIPSAPEWSRRFDLQKLPGSLNSELWLLTVEVYRARHSQPQYSLSRWVPRLAKDQP